MPEIDRVLDPDAAVGAQVRALRKKRDGMTQQGLAERMTELGHETSQPVIGRIEDVDNPRNLTIADLFALAAALDVAPVHLLAGSFDPVTIRIGDALTVDPRHARDWIRGNRPLDDGDELAYFESTSRDEREANHRLRGIWAFRGLLSDYEEAALAGNLEAAQLMLKTLRDELERQQRSLEQDHRLWAPAAQKRLAKRGRRQAAGGPASER